MLLSKTLKEVEEALQFGPFCRVHHSYLINLNFVQKYIKGEGVKSSCITARISR